jgi:beta-phosphoglucomutase-like phosphatase (HAD superfamily)
MLALSFELDGTLVGSVDAHTYAWQRALTERRIVVDGWAQRHGRRAVHARGGAHDRTPADRGCGARRSGAARRVLPELLPARRALPGAPEPAVGLRGRAIVHRIGTSGGRARPLTRRSSRWAQRRARWSCTAATSPRVEQPETDLFLTCVERLGAAACDVIGDAVSDVLAAGQAQILSIGLVPSGYGAAEPTRASAGCAYRDAAEVRELLDELRIG